MSKKKSLFGWLFFFVFVIVVAFLATSWLLPKESTKLEQATAEKVQASNQKTSIQYVAIGDSLTQGVGDETQQGGFVSLVEILEFLEILCSTFQPCNLIKIPICV